MLGVHFVEQRLLVEADVAVVQRRRLVGSAKLRSQGAGIVVVAQIGIGAVLAQIGDACLVLVVGSEEKVAHAVIALLEEP